MRVHSFGTRAKSHVKMRSCASFAGKEIEKMCQLNWVRESHFVDNRLAYFVKYEGFVGCGMRSWKRSLVPFPPFSSKAALSRVCSSNIRVTAICKDELARGTKSNLRASRETIDPREQ